MSVIKVLKAGIHDSFRDGGRDGYASQGINRTGAEDPIAYSVGRMLTGNADSVASLEYFFPAPIIRFEIGISFVLTGATFGALLNKTEVQPYRVTEAEAGDALSFPDGGRCRVGYLSVPGGFAVDSWLDSESTNTYAERGGLKGRLIESGDHISLRSPQIIEDAWASHMIDYDDSVVDLIAAVDAEYLTAQSDLELISQAFHVSSDSNRMAIRIEGPKLRLLDDRQRISTAVRQGTIQLLPDGSLLVLMSDHQTTGGYPIIGSLTTRSISVLAQKQPGQEIRFRFVDTKNAVDDVKRIKRDFDLLRFGLKLRQD